MESDYPDLYSQYSKIHSNNVETEPNSDNGHYQTNDMKPVDVQENNQNDTQEDDFGHIAIKNDNVEVKNMDLSQELTLRYENDVSGALAVNTQPPEQELEAKQEETKDDLKPTVTDDGALEQSMDTQETEESKQCDNVPAQSPEPSTEQNSVKDDECKTEKEETTENKEVDVCRVCMQHGVLISMFGTDSKLSMSEKVMSCAAVQIALNDGLPSFICEPCANDLEIAFKFKKRCEESDIALRAKLGLKAKTIVKTEFVLIDCDNEPIISDDNNRYKSGDGSDFGESDDPSYGSKKKKKKTKKKGKTKAEPKKPKVEKLKIEKSKITGRPKANALKPKEKPVESSRAERALKRKATTKAESDDDVIVVSKKQPPPPKTKKPNAPVGRFPCTFCEKSFPYPSVLKLHMVTHTKEKIHKCSICTASFMYSKELYTHYKDTHPNEYGKDCDEKGQYNCSTCKKSFMQLKHLKVHETIHVRDKKYKCELCPQTFTNMTSQNLHMKMDHPENSKPYKCKICDKRFKQQQTMEKHLENHKNSRPIEKIEEKRPTSTKDLFKSIAPLTTTYWSDSFSD